MKKTLILLTVLAVTILSACKKEPLATVAQNIGAPAITSPAAATSIAVTPTDSAQMFSVKWGKADYGVKAVVSYFVEIDSAGRNFSKHIVIGNTSADSLSMTNGTLNTKLLTGLNLPANVPSTIELRVGSAIYGKDSVYTKTITLTVTTYKELAPPQLYVPGAYQGWNPGAAPEIYEVTTYTYDGYVYMNTADYFKFTSAPDWNHINYGDGGNGTLSTDGLAAGLKVNAPGYYKLDADTKNLTYSATLIQSFGIIGTATPGQWNNSTAMTYNQSTGVWTVTAALVPGALKFRANDAWDINYGPADTNALNGSLIFNDPGAITINDAGNYTITLDMSQSTQKKYLYKIVKD